jgi:hypothetical protein
MTRGNGNSYSPEVRERAVRMVMEHRGEHASEGGDLIDCREDRLQG